MPITVSLNWIIYWIRKTSPTVSLYRSKPNVPIPSNSPDLVDRLSGTVLHSHQQPSRVQNSIVMGSIKGLYPGVPPIIRHIHIRPHHWDGITNTPWWNTCDTQKWSDGKKLKAQAYPIKSFLAYLTQNVDIDLKMVWKKLWAENYHELRWDPLRLVHSEAAWGHSAS